MLSLLVWFVQLPPCPANVWGIRLKHTRTACAEHSRMCRLAVVIQHNIMRRIETGQGGSSQLAHTA